MNLNQNKISGDMKLFISVFTFFAVCFTFADAQMMYEDHPRGIREVFHSVPSIPAHTCKDKPECGQLLKAMGGSCADVPMNRAMIYCQKTCGYCNTAAISADKPEFGVDPEVRKARFQRISETAAKQVGIESRFAEELPSVQIDESVGPNPESIADVNKRTGIADYLYQGDIILSEEEMDELEREVDGSERRKRQAPTYAKKWTDNTLYFYFEDDIHEHTRKNVYAAHQYIQSRTCINFVENSTASNVVRVYDGDGCASAVGMQGGNQGLTLGGGCGTFGTAAHEFIHALGFSHEQSRSDRDQFITLNKTNIKQDELHNFKQISAASDENYTPYEYGSVMHYGPISFANNSKYLTMVPRNADYLYTMGHSYVSFSDILKINAHYGCDANCDAQTSAKCHNGGYPNPRNCSQCNCPTGYAGDFCDQRPSGCGGILYATPEWQVNIIRNKKDDVNICTSWITAPEGAKIEVELNNMFGTTCNYGCNSNGIEIKGYDQRLTNPVHCCKGSLGTVVKSTLNPTPIITHSRVENSVYAIRYRYVDGPANPPTQAPGTTTEPWNCVDSNPWLCEWTVNSVSSCEKQGIDWAVANCPKTCGFCDSVPINTFAPTTAAPSTTPQNPPCEDREPAACAQLAKRGVTCEQLQSSTFAGYCDKTCGLCGAEATTTVAPTTTQKSCEDARPKECEAWIKGGNTCAALKGTYADGFCNKTCGLCGGSDEPPTTTTSKAPCMDRNSGWCTQYVRSNGNCDRLPTRVATAVCAKSCGYCA